MPFVEAHNFFFLNSFVYSFVLLWITKLIQSITITKFNSHFYIVLHWLIWVVAINGKNSIYLYWSIDCILSISFSFAWRVLNFSEGKENLIYYATRIKNYLSDFFLFALINCCHCFFYNIVNNLYLNLIFFIWTWIYFFNLYI